MFGWAKPNCFFAVVGAVDIRLGIIYHFIGFLHSLGVDNTNYIFAMEHKRLITGLLKTCFIGSI